MVYRNARGQVVPDHLLEIVKSVERLARLPGVLSYWRKRITAWAESQISPRNVERIDGPEEYIVQPALPAADYARLPRGLRPIDEKYAILAAVHDFAAAANGALIGPHDAPGTIGTDEKTTAYAVLKVAAVPNIPAEDVAILDAWLTDVAEAVKLSITPADLTGATGDLVARLLAGPDNIKLTPSELAMLEAYLKQPVSLSTIQQEQRATGESETLAKRNKLTLIRDFNRNLQATQLPSGSPIAGAADNASEPATGATPGAKKAKRSTERGEGREKLIAALTKHHKYADDGCLNLDPIGNNELARLATVSDSTASSFFKKKFGGHTKYRTFYCRDAGRLVAAIKQLRQEYSPDNLFGRAPRGERDRDDEE